MVCAWGAGHNKTKDEAVHSLMRDAGFDAVPKVGAGYVIITF